MFTARYETRPYVKHYISTSALQLQSQDPLSHVTSWLLYMPSVLTFKNPTFRSHSVFMCFVWISEQTAIISLCSIKWVVFITETLMELAEVRWLTTFRPNHRSGATACLRKLSPPCGCALALCHVQKPNNLSVLK